MITGELRNKFKNLGSADEMYDLVANGNGAMTDKTQPIISDFNRVVKEIAQK